ncbi:PDZ and LIM domain protein Zasp isoform X2 [Belonocnema kinseyi]|uniref:PDZ and LIM domain protein Zasp isoform X2 n=1 Tax=Belonocnema kinseyi TaxID=2817044 RepID=UPI00143DE2EF|nr:PDZ and LIM domain protein Zasp isoform X2 [Belonocnema kinseyi]
MAQLISVKLSRFEGSPWGFRLQGGKDFGTPLIVQKVNGGSPAEAAGLKAGDAVIRVNNTDMFNLRHKDAQDVIVRAGNSFEVTVQRGGSTWKPSVTPISSALPSPTPSIPANNVSPVTKTSLAAKKNDGPLIGSGHNFSPKPFLNGSSEGPIKSIVNKQYNSPVGIYSEETIAETLSAQAEVLAGGVLGVNFKKNEKNYNAQNSEVFKMVQEADKEPRTPEPVPSRTEFYSSVSHAVGGQATSPRSPTPLSRALGLCQTVSNSYETSSHQETQRTERRYDNSSSSYTPSDTPICHNCDNAIVGVFVRIKDKNLHVDCFKCSTCGTSLKNVGYYNINEKLYCDIHAKMVARQQAPSSLTPVTVQLGSKAPAGTISAALSNIGPLSPSLSNHGSSPQPFSSCHRINSDSRLADHQTSLKMNGKTTNGYLGENESNGTSKTYTSTITIQTGHKEVCNVEGELDYNRNPTNLKARYKFDEINEIQFDPIISDNKNSKNATSHCTEKILTSYPQQPTRLGTSIVDSPSLRPVQAPTSNNIGGSKLYGGSSFNTPNYSSPPTYNSGSSTLPRPQSQTVTESYIEECSSYELNQGVARPVAEKPPTPRPKSHIWPPPKPIEEITYPTASPLYIDPNPALDRRSRERGVSVEGSIENQSRRNSFVETYEESRDRCQIESNMDQVNCPGPVYRRVELFSAARKDTRQTRSDSRASSTDSIRRSLTPTRITQPIPRPWTATVTTGTNLYQQAYPVSAPEPPKTCSRTVCRRQICRRECVCEGLGRTQTTYQEERNYQEQICDPAERAETTPKPDVEVYTCVRLPHSHSRTIETRTNIRESEVDTDTEVRDLSKLVPPDVAVCPKGIDGEHDLYTETEEKDVGELHIKKTTTYEKTVELVSPNRELRPCVTKQEPEPKQVEQTRWEQTTQRRSAALDREVEDISSNRSVVESTECLTSRIDTQQLMEQAKRDEEEAQRRRQAEERRQHEECERRQREEEERKRLAAEERKQRQEEERRREEERRQLEQAEQQRQDEREKRQKRVCFSEEREFICEETRCPRERIVDIQMEDEGPKEHIVDIEVEGRPKERIIDIKIEQDEPPCECLRMSEMREEINVQDHEEQRRRSLREQVQVHKSLRDQQAPEKRQSQTLQERRLCTKYGQNSQESQNATETCRKQVQFTSQSDSGPRTLPPSSIKNTIPREWKSEMVKALTTAPAQPYCPFSKDNSGCKDVYTHEVTYEETCTCKNPSLPPLPRQNRPVSPFQSALTTAPERPYTPLGEDVNPCRTCSRRSQTPSAPSANDGYCAPAQLLFSENREVVQERKKPQGPQPLPTPPPDYRLRDSSRSPTRSRPGTPGSRSTSAGLKKPDTIPIYQQHLVAMQKGPVESYAYDPSRTPTPCSRSKSPAQGPPSAPACFIKAQAPRIREKTPPCRNSSQGQNSAPKTEQECVCYHYDEDTPAGHTHTDYRCTKCVTYSEDEEGSHTHIREQKVQRVTESPTPPTGCYLSRSSSVSPALPCPSTRESVSERIQRQGVRVLPPCSKTSSEVRRIRHEIVEKPAKPPCSNTGVTIVPCRAVLEGGSKTGVVVVPCDGSASSCDRSGICVTPTLDRQGVCVSPGHDLSGEGCGLPSVRSGGCSIDAGTCSGSGVCVTPCGDGSFCVAPCSVSGVSSVSCPKSILKEQCGQKILPYPQIPLPNEEPEKLCSSCPLSQTPSKPDACSSFQPVHKPRTNLGSQLTQLTTLNRVKPPNVQLYKPQPKPQSQTTTSQYLYQSQSIQSKTQSQTQTQSKCPISKTQNLVDPPNLSSLPDLGVGIGGLGSNKSGSFAGSSAPKRGKGILNQASGAGSRVPLCGRCNNYVRGPFITALGQIWCPEHFVCGNAQCSRGLQDIGFVEEKGQLYCEYCFEKYIAPPCNKCGGKIKGDCLNAVGKHYHPECFNCSHCGKLFGNSPFFLEDGLPYCENDWNNLFTTKCFACGFPVEAGDRWVEALNNNYHSQCFNCTMCKKNLEGQSFYAKAGRPFCKNHAR